MFSHHHASRQLCCSPTWLLSGGLLLGVLLALSQAQVPTAIRPDGTLGTAVTQSGNISNITGGTRPGNGPNLFHSFDRFSVGTNDTARFSGPTGIENILSRVTGGQQSVIDGRLQSTIPGANLYLLNPSGVLFGPNATLDVSGSFHVSTADFLRFTDGAKFSANLGQESTLTVAPPAAFGFLGNNPAPITIRGSALQVPEGKALSVVGGDITIMGNGPLTDDSLPTLRAPGGRLQLVSVASPGEVVFSSPELAPDLGVDSFAQLGRLEFSHGAFLDASGNGGGLVLLRGRSLRVDQSWIFGDNTGPLDGTGLGLDIQITADALIMGGADLANGTYLTADSLGAGRARDVRLMAGNVYLDRATIGSRAFSLGDAGHVAISASTLTMDDGQIQAGTGEGSRGNAGGLEVRVGTLRMDGGRIWANTLGDGNAGNVEVRVGKLTLMGGAQISNSNGATRFINGVPTFIGGQGRGGDLTVVATESISIAGQDSEGFRSGLFSNTSGSGDAGGLLISTPLLSMMDGGRIVTRTLGDGNAGNIEIRTGRLTLTGGAQIFSGIGDFEAGAVRGTQGPGRGGNVTVNATDSIFIAGRDSEGFLSSILSIAQIGRGAAGSIALTTGRLTLTDSAQISSDTSSGGAAGNIALTTGRLTLTDGAQISSSNRGGIGRGGRLTVTATESITITGQDSEGFRSGLFSNTNGAGDAGGLLVSTPLLSIDGGRIVTRTLGEGNAGDLEIQTGRLTLTGGAQILSGIGRSAGGTVIGIDGPGQGGNITITATEALFMAGQDRDGFLSSISSQALIGRGAAGNIALTTGRLTLTDGAQIDGSTQANGRGGNIAIRGQHIDLSKRGTISARSSGQGDAGNIRIQADETFQSQNGVVTTTAEQSGGGQIELRAGRLVQLRDSELTTTVQGGGSDAGNLTVDAPFIVAGGSQLVAKAFEGRGGNIRINAEVFLADPASRVDASSTLGISGTVDIQAPVTNLSGLVTPLPPEFAPATALLRDRCAARLREGAVSSFVERGRDGVPANPEGVLPSRLYSESAGAASSTSETAVTRRGGLRPDDNRQRQARRHPATKSSSLAQQPDCTAQ